MNHKKLPKNSYILSIPYVILGVGFLILLSFVLGLNAGKFIYTLDDPYIHLSLADNIAEGHYGINKGEFSAPSSSIIWPFILAAVSVVGFDSEYAPLFLNILFSFAFIIYLQKKFSETFHARLVALISIFMIFFTNQLGLIFTGMEHSLQVFSCLVLFFSNVKACSKSKLNTFELINLFIFPLIRYENFALFGLSFLLIFFSTKDWNVVLAASLSGLLVLGFTYFLYVNSGYFLPSSIIAKSSTSSTSSFLKNIIDNSKDYRSYILVMFNLLGMCSVSKTKEKRDLGLIVLAILSSLAHLFLARFGYYSRYGIYILSYSALTFIFIHRTQLTKAAKRVSLIRFYSLAAVGLVFISPYQIWATITTPLSSKIIYDQQYQMRRFIVEQYKAPFGVNDIGLVSYKNDYYILDLFGLASLETLKARKEKPTKEWLNEITKKKNVKLIMIYDSWFGELPENWISLGSLVIYSDKLTQRKITVSFYCEKTDQEDALKKIYSYAKKNKNFRVSQQLFSKLLDQSKPQKIREDNGG